MEEARSVTEESALQVARDWLALIDEGKFGQGYEDAASLMQGAVEKDQLEQQLEGIRAPLGELVNRRVTATTYATELPGAPDGEYVIIQFDTEFEHKNHAVETVTPMKDTDGQWRVSGYFIK